MESVQSGKRANITSESINKVLKTFSSSGNKIFQAVFRSVYKFKMDHNLRRDARENVQENDQTI